MELTELQKQSADPNLWDNPDNARRIMQQVTTLAEQIQEWDDLSSKISDAIELAQLDDNSLIDDINPKLFEKFPMIKKMEKRKFKSFKILTGYLLYRIHKKIYGFIKP